MQTLKESDNYCIKQEYQIASRAFVSEEDLNYDWTEGRIRMNGFYQFYVYKYAHGLIRSNKLKNVLDVGCGPGLKLMEMLHPICKQTVGIDRKDAIDICINRYPEGEFYVDNFDTPSLDLPRKFDLIICADVIEHVIDPDNLIRYIKSYAHPESYIILSTPERDRLRGPECTSSPKPEHIREWNKEEFIHYLQSRGLSIIQHRKMPKMKFNFREYRKMLRNPFSFYNKLIVCQMAICQIAENTTSNNIAK